MSILLNNGIDKNIVTFDLRSPEAIAKMNGTIAGSPTFSRDGIKLDGTNDEITFNLSNTLLSMPKLTISVDFIPEFNLDDGNAYHIFDTDSASRCYLLKNNVGNFQIGWNGVNLTTISKATYSSYWKENEMNKLLVSTESGVLNVYLNNNLIANSSPTWTSASPVTLYVGRSNAGIYHFKGTIKSISFKNDLSTEGEVSDLYDNSTFNFQNKADIWLDMATQRGVPGDTEILIDGDCEAEDTSAWTIVQSAGVIEKVTTDPHSGVRNLKITKNSLTKVKYGQNRISPTKIYRATGWARGTGTSKIWIGTSNEFIVANAGTTEWTYFDITAEALGDYTFYVGGSVPASGDYVEFDDLSVVEVKPITLDKSGHGNNFYVNGATFLNPGFNLNGSGNYLKNSNASGIYNNTYQTIAICFNPDFNSDDGANSVLIDSVGGNKYRIYKTSSNEISITFGGTLIAVIPNSMFKNYWNVYGNNVLVVTGTTGNTDAYLNNFKILDADNTAWTPGEETSIYLGVVSTTNGAWYAGTINHFSTYGKRFAQKMTPTQVRALTSQLFNTYSK